MKSTPDPRIDAYIANAGSFAQPILKRLRKIVHLACPGAQETVKWSCPHFTFAGSILCSMAAFKEHVTFGFWHQGMQTALKGEGAKSDEAMGSFGRIRRMEDLPNEAALVRLIKQAMLLNEAGGPSRPKPKAKAELAVPAPLATALKANLAANVQFAKFSPSHRREYIQWIAEAKRDETKQKRIETAIEWLAAGKSRNWKYANC
ncbi:MAG: YdeI/OmpD-associated family protein [Opitutus sp.]